MPRHSSKLVHEDPYKIPQKSLKVNEDHWKILKNPWKNPKTDPGCDPFHMKWSSESNEMIKSINERIKWKSKTNVGCGPSEQVVWKTDVGSQPCGSFSNAGRYRFRRRELPPRWTTTRRTRRTHRTRRTPRRYHRLLSIQISNYAEIQSRITFPGWVAEMLFRNKVNIWGPIHLITPSHYLFTESLIHDDY